VAAAAGDVERSAKPELVIGAAGAPAALFGPADAPKFEAVFSDLRHHGFNVFFPCFITRETTDGTSSSEHAVHFFDMDPSSATYAGGEHSPYRAARGRIGILFPLYVFVPEEQWSTEVDAGALRDVLARFRDECLGGDACVLAGFENYDEPASRYVVGDFAPQEATRFSLSNLGKAAECARAVYGDVPVYVVEGALPFVVDRDRSVDPIRAQVDEAFLHGVGESVRSADWYGFDVYPVPLTRDLSVVGDYVRRARGYAPGKRIVSVIQGFGGEDLGRDGRRPTAAENRLMAYESVIQGADGVIWWGQSAMDLTESADLWESILSTGRELRRLEPVLSLPATTVECDNGAVSVTGRASSKVAYALVANPSPRKQAAAFGLRLPEGHEHERQVTVTDLLTGNVIRASVDGGICRFTARLEAYGVRVWAAPRPVWPRG